MYQGGKQIKKIFSIHCVFVLAHMMRFLSSYDSYNRMIASSPPRLVFAASLFSSAEL